MRLSASHSLLVRFAGAVACVSLMLSAVPESAWGSCGDYLTHAPGSAIQIGEDGAWPLGSQDRELRPFFGWFNEEIFHSPMPAASPAGSLSRHGAWRVPPQVIDRQRLASRADAGSPNPPSPPRSPCDEGRCESSPAPPVPTSQLLQKRHDAGALAGQGRGDHAASDKGSWLPPADWPWPGNPELAIDAPPPRG